MFFFFLLIFTFLWMVGFGGNVRYEEYSHILWSFFPARRYLVLSSACSTFPQIKTALSFHWKSTIRSQGNQRTRSMLPRSRIRERRETPSKDVLHRQFPNRPIFGRSCRPGHTPRKNPVSTGNLSLHRVSPCRDSNIIHQQRKIVKPYFIKKTNLSTKALSQPLSIGWCCTNVALPLGFSLFLSSGLCLFPFHAARKLPPRRRGQSKSLPIYIIYTE